HRPHPVRGRLAVRAEQAGGAMDGYRAAVRRGQGQDPERQCGEAVPPLAAAAPQSGTATQIPPAALIRLGRGWGASPQAGRTVRSAAATAAWIAAARIARFRAVARSGAVPALASPWRRVVWTPARGPSRAPAGRGARAAALPCAPARRPRRDSSPAWLTARGLVRAARPRAGRGALGGGGRAAGGGRRARFPAGAAAPAAAPAAPSRG